MVEAVLRRLNQTSFHMRWMVRVDVEVLASVGGFPEDFGGQGHLFPDDQNIKKGNHTVRLYFHNELDGWP